MLDQALETFNDTARLYVHSDSGAHHRWPGQLKSIHKYGLTQSMSKKGCSPDNSAYDGVYGRLKNEIFYGLSWRGISIDEFIEYLNHYIYWYNEKRSKVSLGGLSPVQY